MATWPPRLSDGRRRRIERGRRRSRPDWGGDNTPFDVSPTISLRSSAPRSFRHPAGREVVTPRGPGALRGAAQAVLPMQAASAASSSGIPVRRHGLRAGTWLYRIPLGSRSASLGCRTAFTWPPAHSKRRLPADPAASARPAAPRILSVPVLRPLPGEALESGRQIVAAQVSLVHVPHPLACFPQRRPGELLDPEERFGSDVGLLGRACSIC